MNLKIFALYYNAPQQSTFSYSTNAIAACKFNLRYYFVIIIIIITIIMFMKVYACFLFLDPQEEVGPSISSSVVLRSFIPLVYIVGLVLVVYLCPSSVRVVATFSGTVLFPLQCSVLPFFP